MDSAAAFILGEEGTAGPPVLYSAGAKGALCAAGCNNSKITIICGPLLTWKRGRTRGSRRVLSWPLYIPAVMITLA